MDYSFKPCHFTDNVHDLPKEAVGKLFKFSGGDSVTVGQHLNRFTCVMILYCRFPQYNHEDFKMRLFVHSLEGDALNWFNNFPNDFFTSLQDILNAFKDRYDSPNSLPSASKIVQQNESNLIRGPAERSQDDSSCQNVSSTGNIADQVHDSEKSGTNDNGKEEQKQIIQELMMLVKNMEINQTNYVNDVRTLCTQLEIRNRGMEIMQNQHAKEIEAMKANHDTKISFMQSKLSGLEENMMTMQANHEKEINSMQHCLMTIKEKDDKVIKDMEANQICLQKKLLTMEEDHARKISAIKVEYSSQIDAIKIQVQKFQQWSEDKRNQGTSIDQEPPYLLQQAPSYYEILCSIEKWIIEGDMVNPPVIEDQVITHGTCETDP